jgi:hypothetical protein
MQISNFKNVQNANLQTAKKQQSPAFGKIPSGRQFKVVLDTHLHPEIDPLKVLEDTHGSSFIVAFESYLNKIKEALAPKKKRNDSVVLIIDKINADNSNAMIEKGRLEFSRPTTPKRFDAESYHKKPIFSKDGWTLERTIAKGQDSTPKAIKKAVQTMEKIHLSRVKNASKESRDRKIYGRKNEEIQNQIEQKAQEAKEKLRAYLA